MRLAVVCLCILLTSASTATESPFRAVLIDQLALYRDVSTITARTSGEWKWLMPRFAKDRNIKPVLRLTIRQLSPLVEFEYQLGYTSDGNPVDESSVYLDPVGMNMGLDRFLNIVDSILLNVNVFAKGWAQLKDDLRGPHVEGMTRFLEGAIRDCTALQTRAVELKSRLEVLLSSTTPPTEGPIPVTPLTSTTTTTLAPTRARRNMRTTYTTVTSSVLDGGSYLDTVATTTFTTTSTAIPSTSTRRTKRPTTTSPTTTTTVKPTRTTTMRSTTTARPKSTRTTSTTTLATTTITSTIPVTTTWGNWMDMIEEEERLAEEAAAAAARTFRPTTTTTTTTVDPESEWRPAREVKLKREKRSTPPHMIRW